MQFLLFKKLSLFFIFQILKNSAEIELKKFPTTQANGDALYLTPYIRSGKFEEARRLARVKNFTKVESYSGYLTVNPKYNANLFFWFFPAVNNRENAPFMTWVQGGPGSSGLYGVFVENGPFKIRKNKVSLRRYAWTNTHSVIYFDSPVGTGFSYADKPAYANTSAVAANDLYIALTQFFTLFSTYSKNDFYLAGESYAGKFIPALALKIHKENLQNPKIRINLKGLAIGNGFIDPVSQLRYGAQLYSFGLIDNRELKHFYTKEEQARKAIKQKNLEKADSILIELIEKDGGSTYFTRATGVRSVANVLQARTPRGQRYVKFLGQSDVRQALHVGLNKYDHVASAVQKRFLADYYANAVPKLTQILDARRQTYQVLLYSGNLDISVSTVTSELMLNKMRWSGAKVYAQAHKTIWRLGKNVVGYVKRAKNLTFLVIRNAGHIVIYDQPKVAYEMISRFTSNKNFN